MGPDVLTKDVVAVPVLVAVQVDRRGVAVLVVAEASEAPVVAEASVVVAASVVPVAEPVGREVSVEDREPLPTC